MRRALDDDHYLEGRYAGAMDLPSEREQLDAIVGARTYQLVNRYLGGDYGRERELYTVTPDQVLAHARTVGLPSWVQYRPNTYDGIYIVPRGDRWAVYHQERGKSHGDTLFDTKDEAFEHVVMNDYVPRCLRGAS